MTTKDDRRGTREGGSIDSLDSLLPALHNACLQAGVALAYLYGSQARGDAGPLSDVDVAVLFQPEVSPAERSDRVLHLIGEFMTIFKRTDVFVADLASASPLLRHRVYRDGILLYCADDRLRVKFMTEALRDYEDTRPLRDVQWMYLKQRIANGTFGRARVAIAEDREKYGKH
jgi:predicted nucleotidyltransferase